MLAGAQLGITICSILLGRVGEPAVAHLIEAPMDLVGIPDALLHPIGFTIALILVVALHILLGEMVPKNIALAGPEASAAMLLVPVHLAWIRIAKPFIAFYNLAANLALRVLRIEPRDELDATVSAGELAEMIGESPRRGTDRRRGARAADPRAAHRRADGVRGRDPLADLRSVRATTDPGTGRTGPTLGSIERAVSETGFSRFPVRGTDGTFTGYLHLKDVLDEILDESVGPDTIIGADTIRPLPVISGDTSLDEATASLRRTSAHLGTVVDGNGRTTGVVALEDLVEEFVGTVRDETHRCEGPRGRRLDRARRRPRRAGGHTPRRSSATAPGRSRPPGVEVPVPVLQPQARAVAALASWLRVGLAGAPEHRDWPHYVPVDGAVTIGHDPPRRPPRHHRPRRRLLSATADRTPRWNCFGLHEWAMVYRDVEAPRHDVPLRLGAQGTDRVVERQGLRCTHFDAFRFFTDDAVGRNAQPLSRAASRRDRAAGLCPRGHGPLQVGHQTGGVGRVRRRRRCPRAGVRPPRTRHAGEPLRPPRPRLHARGRRDPPGARRVRLPPARTRRSGRGDPSRSARPVPVPGLGHHRGRTAPYP